MCVLLQHGAQVHHAALDGYTALHNAALKVGRDHQRAVEFSLQGLRELWGLDRRGLDRLSLPPSIYSSIYPPIHPSIHPFIDPSMFTCAVPLLCRAVRRWRCCCWSMGPR